MYTVGEIMTRELHTLTPENTLADARSLMSNKHVRHIPIVDGDGELLGLVTQRDALAAMDSVLFGTSEEQRKAREEAIRIDAFMTTDVATVDVRADMRSAALYLERNKHGCLPVIKDGKLCGIVTEADFVGVAINLLEQQQQNEPVEPYE